VAGAVLLGRIGAAPLAGQVFLVTLGVCLLKVVFSSNTVTATILIPLIIGWAGRRAAT